MKFPQLKALLVLMGLVGLGWTGVPFGGLAAAQPPAQLEQAVTLYLPIAARKYPLIPPLGIENTFSLAREPWNEHLNALRLGWTRLNDRISWRQLQPNENDPIQWSQLEAFEAELLAIKAAGAKPIVVVDDYPRWATVYPTSCGPILPKKYRAFGTFVAQLAARYSNPTYNAYDWELGNEIDIDPDNVMIDSGYGCWGNEDDPNYGGGAYGYMLKMVTPLVKAHSPDARIWTGGLMLSHPVTNSTKIGKPERFLNGVLEVGAGPYFDVVAFHGHTGYWGKTEEGKMIDSDSLGSGDWVPIGGGVKGKAKLLRDIMASYGISKPLSLNEVSVGCSIVEICGDPQPEYFQFQANLGVRMAVRSISARIDSFVWYTLNGPDWRINGLLDSNLQPRPVYIAYAQLLDQVRSRDYRGPVDYGAGIEAYRFCDNTPCVDIVWTEHDQTLPVFVPRDRLIQVYDRDGVEQQPALSGQTYQVMASFAPIYIVRTQ